MAGIIKKVEQTLGMGGPKEGDKQPGEHKPGCQDEHKPEQKGEQKPGCQDEHKPGCQDEHKPEQKGEHKPGCQDEHKEGGGFMDKVKGKIPGVGGQEEKGEEKK